MVFKNRGIKGNCHYNAEMKMFVGELVNIETLITFKGGSINEVKKAFIEASNKYLDNKNKLNH